MTVTKKTLLAIAIPAIAVFLVLVYYGLTHARGEPVAAVSPPRLIIEVPFMARSIDLSKGLSPADWAAVPGKEVGLTYQVMILPWGKGLVPAVNVKAFHNGREIYFYLTWKDDTENRLRGVGQFSDAAALMFPLADDAPPSTLMMGFAGKPGANIWHWKADQDQEFWQKQIPERAAAYADWYYPFEGQELFPLVRPAVQSAVSDLLAVRPGTLTPKENQQVQGRGLWENGSWHVVFQRALAATDPQVDAVIKPGTQRLVAFAVWDGAKGDRGGRKSISDWVILEVK